MSNGSLIEPSPVPNCHAVIHIYERLPQQMESWNKLTIKPLLPVVVELHQFTTKSIKWRQGLISIGWDGDTKMWHNSLTVIQSTFLSRLIHDVIFYYTSISLPLCMTRANNSSFSLVRLTILPRVSISILWFLVCSTLYRWDISVKHGWYNRWDNVFSHG